MLYFILTYILGAAMFVATFLTINIKLKIITLEMLNDEDNIFFIILGIIIWPVTAVILILMLIVHSIMSSIGYIIEKISSILKKYGKFIIPK